MANFLKNVMYYKKNVNVTKSIIYFVSGDKIVSEILFVMITLTVLALVGLTIKDCTMIFGG